MKYIAKFIFWVAPEDREAKFAYIMGARSLAAFIRAIGPSKTLIEDLTKSIMDEMGMDKKGVLRAIAKMWGITINFGEK